MDEVEWQRAYALLVLRADRLLRAAGYWSLDYYGPGEWQGAVEAEEPPVAERLAADADELLATVPEDRAEFLTALVRAVQALLRPGRLVDVVRECLGVEVGTVPEAVFEAAHERLDRALPGSGTPAERLHTWQRRHELADLTRLPALVDRAVAETRVRTRAIIDLPGEAVDCELLPRAPFRAAGWHRGGTRSTILVSADRPFNLADLLYVVAHEGHPGHIAEQVLKEISLAGRDEQKVRFLPSPPFLLSEGLGLHAQHLVFPGDEAQAWLVRAGIIEDDGSDLAGIHEARDVLFGAHANAALLAADGRPEAEVADYLTRWALLDEAQLRSTLAQLTVPGGNPYVFAYHHGRELVGRFLAPDPAGRARRLLTEQLLPADLA